MSQRVHDLIEDEHGFFTFYITGVTPAAVIQKVDALINIMTVPIIQKLCNVSLLAAASNRANVLNYITKTENVDLARFLRDNYYVQDHVNISHLNLFGHMLLAGGLHNKNTFVEEFRKRIGARSIWECNFNKCDLSYAQKKILSDKIRRITADQVMEPARKLVLALAAKIALSPPPADANVSRNNVSSATAALVPPRSAHGIVINEPSAARPGAGTSKEASSSQETDQSEGLRAKAEAERKAKEEAEMAARRRAKEEANRAANLAKKTAEEAAERAAKEQADKDAFEAAAKEAAEHIGRRMPTPLSVILPESGTAQEPTQDVVMEEVVDEPPAEVPKAAASSDTADITAPGKQPAPASETAEELEKESAEEKKSKKGKETATSRKSVRKLTKEAKAADESGSGTTEAAAVGKRKGSDLLKTESWKTAKIAPPKK